MPDLQAHGRAAGQKAGEKCRTVLDFQPTTPRSDRLPGQHDRLYRTLPEEVLSAHRYLPATLAMHFAGMCLVVFLFWNVVSAQLLVTWVSCFMVVWLGRLMQKLRFEPTDMNSAGDWLRWRFLWNIGSLGMAILWGWASWVLYPLGGFVQQTGLIVIIYTFSVVVVLDLSTQPGMYLAFLGLCFTPLITRIALAGDSRSYELAGILLLILSISVLLARHYREATERVLDLKVRADDLMEQLRAEKSAADDARRVAELANRAKTQFFTAASHDLRQPLHAMGLLVEALRQQTLGSELGRLVGTINSSVDALNELFSELLDISCLDAGVVTSTPQTFEIAHIFRKLRLNFDPIAFEKGLAFRVRGDRQVVHADPVLVERVLRNLVCNALRYTENGTVLVGARRQGGRILLQVLDTGPGISEADQQRIFDEFYQVPRVDLQGGAQPKGLGLGLSIVQRLSHLMDAPLGFRSELGRGTVFSLTLPAGHITSPVAHTLHRPWPLAPTLSGRLIVIVEDECSIRKGLEMLLKGWGAEVLPFDGFNAVQAWMSQGHENAVRPDLMIVDYELGYGANGVEIIDAVRCHFGAPIPAIVVTASTPVDHARAHDLHVLIKPVTPSRLRAMIAFKLGMKDHGTLAAAGTSTKNGSRPLGSEGDPACLPS